MDFSFLSFSLSGSPRWAERTVCSEERLCVFEREAGTMQCPCREPLQNSRNVCGRGYRFYALCGPLCKCWHPVCSKRSKFIDWWFAVRLIVSSLALTLPVDHFVSIEILCIKGVNLLADGALRRRTWFLQPDSMLKMLNCGCQVGMGVDFSCLFFFFFNSRLDWRTRLHLIGSLVDW